MVVSVLLVVNDGVDNENLIFDALDLSGVTYELLIYNNGNRDQEFLESLKSRANLVIDSQNEVSPYGYCLNELLLKASGKYIFIFNQFGYFTENWLLDMAFFSGQVVNAGCIHISEKSNNNNLALTKDHNFICCEYPDEKDVSGNILFSHEVKEEVGGFDVKLNSKQSFHDFLFRAKKCSYLNVVVPDQNFILIDEYEDIFAFDDKQYKSNCHFMTQNKNYFKPIFFQSERSKIILDALNEAFPDKFAVYLERSGEISYLESVLEFKSVEKLYKLSLEYQFTFQLKVMSDVIDNIFINRIGIYINK